MSILSGFIFLLILIIAIEATYLLTKPKSDSPTLSPTITFKRIFNCQNNNTPDSQQNFYAFNREQLCWMMGTRKNAHERTLVTQTFKGAIHKITKGKTEDNKEAYLIYLAADGETDETNMNSIFITPQVISIGKMTDGGSSKQIDPKIIKTWKEASVTQTIDLSKPIDTNFVSFEITRTL